MKLAHLILAHKAPQHLERLVKKLSHTDADIYVHLDKKADLLPFAYIQALPGVTFIVNRVLITWANYSMVKATLNSFKEILSTQNQYSHINLLSGADYPLKDPGTIQQFFFANAGKSFMQYKHVYNDWPETRGRFDMYSFGDYDFPLKYKIQKMANSLMGKRKLPHGWQPYGFSQWITITPQAAQYVVDRLRTDSTARRFFKMTWGVDELVFQTILLNSPLKDTIVNDHKRFIKFKRQASSPDILTMADKDAIVSSDKFYARKFDPEIDSEILGYLDEVTMSPPL